MDSLATEYENDFCAWIDHNIGLLRQGRISEIDAGNIAEELETMGKNQHRELGNRLKILFAHLLKWEFEADHRSKSRKRTIVEQRQQISQLLETSPSLRTGMEEKAKKAYTNAVEYAGAETGISPGDFPRNCPYSLEQALDRNFYPDNPL